jgi:hypothetical protein
MTPTESPLAAAPRVLGSSADVRELLARTPLLGGHARWRVSVRVPGMTPDAERRWERRLGMWLASCGCETGALLALSAILWRTLVVVHDWPPAWGDVAASAGWVFGAAVAGKIVGLAAARAMLARDLERLGRQMDALPAARP